MAAAGTLPKVNRDRSSAPIPNLARICYFGRSINASRSTSRAQSPVSGAWNVGALPPRTTLPGSFAPVRGLSHSERKLARVAVRFRLMRAPCAV